VPREAIGQACATAVPGCLSVSEPTSDQPCCRATHHPIVRAPFCVCGIDLSWQHVVDTMAHVAKTCALCVFESGLRPSICDCTRPIIPPTLPQFMCASKGGRAATVWQQ
jgi:hypothetical protein